MMEHLNHWPIFVTFLTVLVALIFLRPLSHKMKLVDMPGGRKEHTHPTPMIGGIAMYLGFFAGMLLLPDLFNAYRSFMFTALLILIVGILDDLHDISPRVRLLLQLAALCMMAFWGHVSLQHLGNLLSDTPLLLGVWAIPFTLFGAATLINAVNMLDGIDGLASSIGLISFMSLAAIAFLSGFTQDGCVLVLLSVAVLGFMVFNFPFWPQRRALAFMGDAGSTLIGLGLSWFTISLSQSPESIASPAIMLWVVMIPMMDLATVFIKRIKQGRSPLKPGQDHIQHVLQDMGLSRFQTVWMIAGFAFIGQCVAWAMMQYHVPERIVFVSFILLFIVYLIWNLRKGRQAC